MQQKKGYVSFVLHAHLPFIHHPESDDYLEEEWLFEAISETYIPLLINFQKLEEEKVDFRVTMSMTPPLLNMLDNQLLQEKYINYLKTHIELAQKEIIRTKENAKENHIENIEFICGDVEQALADLLDNKKVQPNVILVDPPRRGLDNTTIQNILKVQPQKVVYISCNPATMVRDLKQLEEKYEIKGIQPVDMFPFTSHVETITALKLK